MVDRQVIVRYIDKIDAGVSVFVHPNPQRICSLQDTSSFIRSNIPPTSSSSILLFNYSASTI